MNRAVFLDRDRTINEFEYKGVPEDPDSWNYILKWEDFKFIDGVLEGLRLLRERTEYPDRLSPRPWGYSVM